MSRDKVKKILDKSFSNTMNATDGSNILIVAKLIFCQKFGLQKTARSKQLPNWQKFAQSGHPDFD
jgi:hypothetical protein